METNRSTVTESTRIKVMPKSAGLYPVEEMPKFIKELARRAKKPARVPRSDLVKGTVVVVLEGRFASKRVIFIKQMANNKALCFGPHEINGVPAFIIDERYLLKTSTVINFCANLEVNCDFESKREEINDLNVNFELSCEFKKIQDVLIKEIDKIKFMRSYLNTPFELDMDNFTGVDSLTF